MSLSPPQLMPESFCPAVRNWDPVADGSPAMVIAYGGMRGEEIEHVLGRLAPGSLVFWLEETFSVLSHQLAGACLDGRLHQVSLQEDVSQRFFEVFDPKANIQFELLDARRSDAEEAQRCQKVLSLICEQIRREVFNAGTLVTKGPLWQNNTLANLATVFRNPGTGVLSEAFCDKPAIVLGAGPSLNATLPYLKELQSQFVVIATGTALRPLLNAGIRPDLVVAVDGSHLIAQQFTVPCEDLYFAGATVVYPEVVRGFKGCFFGLLTTSPIDQWVDRHTSVHGPLYAGGTVTISCIDLAVQMGCSPILTAGFDLAFQEDGTTHADSTMYHGAKAQKSTLIPVPGNRTDTVYTSTQFEAYIALVRDYVKKNSESRFVNIADGGARIEGMELDWPESLVHYAGPQFEAKAIIDSLHQQHLPAQEDLAASVRGLYPVLRFLHQVQDDAREGAMLSNRLLLMNRRPHMTDPDEMRSCMDRMQEIDASFESEQEEHDFIKMSLWPAAYELATSRQAHEKQMSDNELAFSRARRFYEQVAGAAKWTAELVQNTCRKLEEKNFTEVSTGG